MSHSMVLGHLEVIGKLLGHLPSDVHGDYMMVLIKKEWRSLFPDAKQCPPVAYVDLWPFAAPIALSIDAGLSAQFTQERSMPKSPQQKQVLYPLTHNHDLSSMEGDEWKTWRKRLNPGFSPQYITSRIPDLVEEISDFVTALRSNAGPNGNWGHVFHLEELTTDLALDVILRFCLNKRIHQQSNKRSRLIEALIETIAMCNFYVHIGNFFRHYSPYRQFRLWRNYRIMLQDIAPFLRERIEGRRLSGGTSDKSLVDMIVKSMEEEKSGIASVDQLLAGPGLLEQSAGQIIVFLFAGHDTTASTMCWAYRVLAQYPEVLARMRAEHDEILGPEPEQAVRVLTENPNLVNSLTYTHAFLRETMRVHCNISTIRQGEAGFCLAGQHGTEYAGVQFPTEGFVLWDGSFAIHRDPEVWHRCEEFLPERFLATDESDPLHPPKNAWRFFELGPRNCIGQHLAVTEIKLALALTARMFDIECAWEQWDEQR
ncbi:cytochrome P450 [Thozetella sp. PMI_491]|nr:cytochrome P450 [Thozetella sp. PMI_491]